MATTALRFDAMRIYKAVRLHRRFFSFEKYTYA